MTTKHTPGPWKVRNWREVFKGTRRICSVNAGESLPIGEELDRAASNARRIVAAVNACEWISTEALESGVVAELLEALRIVRDTLPHINGNASSVNSLLKLTGAAIAKATGEQQ